MSLLSPLVKSQFPIKLNPFVEDEDLSGFYKIREIGRFQQTDARLTQLSNSKLNANLPRIGIQLSSKLKGKFLGSGYESFEHPSSEDLRSFNENLIRQQLQVLKRESCDFVCLGIDASKIISDCLVTWVNPRVSKGWSFCAVKLKDSIFLWRDHEEEDVEDLMSPESFYLRRFKELLLTEEEENRKGSFALTISEFGPHRVQSLSWIDAVNENGDLLGIRLNKEFSSVSLKKKSCIFWAEWIASNWTQLVLGQRDYRGILQSVETIFVREELLSKVSEPEVFQQQQKFLSWVQSELQEKPDGTVITFSWTPADFLYSDSVTSSHPSSGHSSFLKLLQDGNVPDLAVEIDANNNDE